MTGNWVKRLITGVVVATAACAVLLFAGCSTGAWTSDQCDDGQDRAFGVLSGLLTTVMGLAIRLDALDDGCGPLCGNPALPEGDGCARQQSA